jgi:hypothetical protein
VNEDLSVQLFTAIDFGANIGTYFLIHWEFADDRFQYCGCIGGNFTAEQGDFLLIVRT